MFCLYSSVTPYISISKRVCLFFCVFFFLGGGGDKKTSIGSRCELKQSFLRKNDICIIDDKSSRNIIFYVFRYIHCFLILIAVKTNIIMITLLLLLNKLLSTLRTTIRSDCKMEATGVYLALYALVNQYLKNQGIFESFI